jgi:hypothetical protein
MDYKTRVQKLEQRRRGTSSAPVMDSIFAKAENWQPLKEEKFTKIAFPDAVKFAIGSMQPVDAEYTKRSYEEGDRVANQLKNNITIPVKFDYQGSVPLDVHIKGNSDIDLLLLANQFITVDNSILHLYTPYNGNSADEELKDLRGQAVSVLKSKFHQVKVDDSPGKAISLSGGSLQRKVDVIPSHWHDTKEYSDTKLKHHREIYVLDTKTSQRINNKPFMHIALVEEKCNNTRGSLRKVIRLLKNLKFDATPEIDLASYDIVAVAHQMTIPQLTVPFGVDLMLLERTLGHLNYVVANEVYRNSLWVPDGSRKIFDRPEKYNALVRLRDELNTLVQDVARELYPLGFSTSRESALSKSILI